MDIALQILGGTSYLLNKVFFAVAETKSHEIKRNLKIYGWTVYLLGVPAWVIILLSKQNWIAASIEAGGIPSMLMGLYYVLKNSESPNKIFNNVASFFTHSSIILGISYSLINYKGITSFSQILEMGVMIGFLLGSYLLAKNDIRGWLFFMLMNGNMATLMLIQDKPLLAIQQIASLIFVIYGYKSSKANEVS